jgi:ParB-like chromosome segregation protein Spo0J
MSKKNWDPKIEFRDPKLITPYANNTKKHPTEQVDKIAAQIAANGFTQPIVVDASGVVIAGHGRLAAARRLNLSKVPVIVADHLDEMEVKAARIADNKVAESEWDFDMLRFEMGSLHLREFDMSLTAFELDDVARFLKPVEQVDTQVGESIADQSEDRENSSVKQIVLIFESAEYEDVMERLTEMRDTLECASNTELFLKLMDFYDERAS